MRPTRPPTEATPRRRSRPRSWWLLVPVLLLAAACSSTGAGTETTETEPITSTEADPEITTATSEDPATAAEADPASAETEDGDGTTGAACPADAFLVEEVDAYEQTDGYEDPELFVSCTDDTLVVSTNGMINYEFVPITPNDLSAQDVTYEIPLEPEWSDTPSSLELGAVGVAVNGVAIYGPFEAPFDGYGDPVTDGLLDFCNGHTQQAGQYHYHAAPDCVVDLSVPGTVVGYLLDGYSILSPYECADEACSEVVEVRSSYVRVDDSETGAFEAWEYVPGSGDLDECNGKVGADGEYHYYATDEFPYLAFCYHGTTDQGGGDFTGRAPDAGPGGAGGADVPAGDLPRRP